MFEEIVNADSNLLLEKALEFKKNEDYTNYAIHLTMACNLNNEEAMKICAEDCIERLLKKQDFNVTKHFYEATLDFPYSANNMAHIYNNGLTVEINYEKARKLYQFASDRGLISATCNLALLYSRQQDLEKAIELYNICIGNGHFNSIINLGTIYYNKKEFQKAVEYYEMASKIHVDIGIECLVILYKNNPNVRTKGYVTEYFLNLGRENCLKQIYKYENFEIEMLKQRYDMKKENEKLKTENQEMRNHILASPDGPLYFEALEEWKKSRV